MTDPTACETPDLPVITAYLCGDERDGLVCALYSGHPTDRGPGHVWVAVEELIAAGTVAWRAASTSGTTPSENVLHVLAATPEPAPCRCEHPFSDHRTPGTECSVIGCDCEPYEPAPAALDEDGPRVWAPITPDLRAALAAAMNEVDRRSAEEQWPASVSPHHAGCVHVAALAEALAATPAALPSEAKP